MRSFRASFKINALVLILATLLIISVTITVIGLVLASAEDNKAERYSLLSKRLFVENQNDIFVNLAPLRSKVRNSLNKTGILYSFYFEYLPSGTSIRAGDSEEFVGASLMKLPIVMDLYKTSELGRLSLDDSITIDDQALSKKFGLLYQAGAGSSVTLKEAVRLALTESDNTAARIILEQTQKTLKPTDRSLNFLDVDIEDYTDGGQPVILISARAYSSFLKCLYLSCYLDYDDSQEILNILTKADFHSRLEAGVSDKSVRVAHKIGTFSQKSSSDCGIVYVPKRPYLFCLMINSTEANVDKIIADISGMTYKYITEVNTAE